MRTRVRAWKACCVGILAVLTVHPAPSQVSSYGALSPIPSLHAAARLVVIPSVVRSTSGAFVSGLTSKDFVVLDDGKEQNPIDVEQTIDRPLAVVMQTGGTAYHYFSWYAAITKLLRVAPVQKMALVTFDAKPREI